MRFNAKIRDWERKIEKVLDDNAVAMATLLQAGSTMRLNHQDDEDQKPVDEANEIINKAFQQVQAERIASRVSVRDTYKEIDELKAKRF